LLYLLKIKKKIMKKIYFVIVTACFLAINSSCDKIGSRNKVARYFFGETWINEDPVDFGYYLSGGSIGVGGSNYQHSIVELKFDGEEDGNDGYYGLAGSGFSKHNYSSSAGDSISELDWGIWKYKKGGTVSSTGNEINMPEELKENPATLGQLWSSSLNGTYRIYFLDINKKSVKLVFVVMNSATSQTSYYYSPVMTFKRK
jgi:hypothetical protein